MTAGADSGAEAYACRRPPLVTIGYHRLVDIDRPWWDRDVVMRIGAYLFELVAAVAVAVPLSAHAEVYKWVDEKGVVNYSNSPPAGTKQVTQLNEAATKVSVVPGMSKEEIERQRDLATQMRLDRLERQLDQLQLSRDTASYGAPPPDYGGYPTYVGGYVGGYSGYYPGYGFGVGHGFGRGFHGFPNHRFLIVNRVAGANAPIAFPRGVRVVTPGGGGRSMTR